MAAQAGGSAGTSGVTAGVVRDARAADQVLTQARKLVEPALRAVFDDLSPEVGIVASYHAGLSDVDGLPAARPGKAVRPALALACGRAAGGPHEGATQPMIWAALAVELMHDFSLLHDDVMDGDRMRRHRPAAWTVFGVPRAVLTGDTLLALALSHAAAIGTNRLLDTFVRLCVGQGADMSVSSLGDDVDLDEILEVAADKTGALLGCTCELGALAAGAESPEAACYREFGRELGVAFQLTDDLLGIWGDPDHTGKPLRSDLAARKVTLPVAAAVAAANESAEELRGLYRGSGELSTADLERAALLVERAGGRAWARAEARRRLDTALDALSRAQPEPAAEAELRLIASLIVNRDH